MTKGGARGWSATGKGKAVIARIVSGGQTGVDRGALEAAMEAGVETGGWCPKGRRAEDGVIPARYRLRETESAAYKARTQANVRDSDGTLIIADDPRLTGGTAATRRAAERQGKPCLVVARGEGEGDAPARVLDWLERNGIAVLNVAGPRESGCPGIEARAKALIGAVLSTRRRGRRAG